MNVVDYILLGSLLIFALLGFKKGVINSVVTFVGTILVIVLSFYFKNIISGFLYDNVPFFNLFGKFKNVETFNILVFEAMSYALTLTILTLILGIVAKITGVFGKILNHTPIIGLGSRIAGLFLGIAEGIVISFIVVFLMSQISKSTDLVHDSKFGELLLTKTPILSTNVKNTVNSVSEIYKICINYENDIDKTLANKESLRVLLKYKIIPVDTAKELVVKKKLTFNGVVDTIKEFEKES